MFRTKHEGHLDRGAAAVEMALVLPLLLLMLFGLVDFGRGFNESMQLTQAAREGVRLIALGGTEGEAQARAEQAFATADSLNVTVNAFCAAGSTGVGEVTVSARFTYVTPLGPIAGLFGASTLPDVGTVQTLTADGAMRCSG